MPGDAAVAVRVRITGRVQGVWFRAWTVSVARDLCLDGWVRNRTNRSVEAVFCGPAAQVERMVANCAEGPPTALVADVQREAVSVDDLEGQGFHQRPTA